MQPLPTLIARHIRQSWMRCGLLISGVTIALLAFIFIESLVDAWYSGVRNSAKNRLISRNKASLVVPMPAAHYRRIITVPGVAKVGFANWFGGIYKEERNRFPQFAIDENYLELHPEFVFKPEEREAFRRDKRGVVLGRDLSEVFNIKVGDSLALKGTIYPGTWEFIVRGIFDARESSTITKVLFFHWDFLNESIKAAGGSGGQVGVFITEVSPNAAPEDVAVAVDKLFANSYAETLTENETAFQQSFVSMSQTIIVALHSISAVIIVVIALVLSNAMLMAARERTREYAILRTIGFTPYHIAFLLIGEAFVLLTIGLGVAWSIAGIVFSLPPRTVLGDLAQFFPSFELNEILILWSILGALLLAILTSIAPIISTIRLPITQAIRKID